MKRAVPALTYHLLPLRHTLKYHETPIPGAYVIDLDPYTDERGFFARLFCAKEFQEKGLSPNIAQVNNSRSVYAGTLRGLHYQLPPFAEDKLVRCIQGSIFDVVLDLRKDSATFGQWRAETLTAENRKMLYIPKGCAHGFITLEPNSEIIYFVSAPYSKEYERGVRYNDPRFNIAWPLVPKVISERDLAHPDFIGEGVCVS